MPKAMAAQAVLWSSGGMSPFTLQRSAGRARTLETGSWYVTEDATQSCSASGPYRHDHDGHSEQGVQGKAERSQRAHQDFVDSVVIEIPGRVTEQPFGDGGHAYTCDGLTEDEKRALIALLRAN